MNRNKGKVFFNEDSLRDLWENIKHTTLIHYYLFPEGEEIQKEVENIFEDIRA